MILAKFRLENKTDFFKNWFGAYKNRDFCHLKAITNFIAIKTNVICEKINSCEKYIQMLSNMYIVYIYSLFVILKITVLLL